MKNPENGSENRFIKKPKTDLENSGENKAGKKRFRKRLLISLAALAAGMVVIASAVLALRERDSCQVDEAVQICVNGQALLWPEGLRLVHRDGITVIRDGDGEKELESYPLVLTGSGSLLLQKTMLWNRTDAEEILRLDYFSRVEQGISGPVLSGDGARVENPGGFLYDGKDTYIFLENAELVWNGESRMEVHPLTVVQVSYRGEIHIYGPGVEPLFEQLTTEEVTARFDSQKRINLATDQYFMPNGTWRLLFMPVEYVDAIK